jgi:ATP phosphoribosyltransferase
MLTIAIQKSGRLFDETKKLLNECGISFNGGKNSKLLANSPDFPLRVLFLRDDDIPECVADAVADVGIVGENEYLEKEKTLTIAKRLGFARCRLSIALPKQMKYDSLSDLQGKSIATSYPNVLRRFLDEKGVECNIRQINGSVEIAPKIGLADAIFDIVSTGSALVSNGLSEVEVVTQSEAILVAHPDLDEEKSELLRRLIFRIDAVKKARNTKYILLNAPNDKIEEICKLLPGMKSPTVLPLAESGWSSIHSVIGEKEFWENIESLKKAGAQGILIVPIEKMIL